ncbi:uncharacterized protein LOC115950943 [Quercus lobata]|uniref:EF-hand domain-containing protein n=1 Tax=Quercus lobata TaxID=97700 RepID=A0A7N2LYQ4_QUELO|nr:uncharacterized protein LOC115950943 [Quercus lobata]
MEEFHEVAIAYYNNAPRNLQRLAWSFFLALDSDGDGQISYTEYINFLRQCGYGWISSNFFKDLDRNRDGCLGFWEVLTLYYVIKTRGLWCQGCQTCLVGLYFTCVSCFDSGSRTYDLCSACYKQKKFSHNHTNFMDNHLLLRSKRGLPAGTANINLALAPRPAINAAAAVDDDLMQSFQALETGVAGGKPNTCIVM